MTAFKALWGYQVTSKLVSNCILALKRLSALKTVVLRWVSDHQGIEGTENKSKLAIEEVLSPFYDPEPT